MDEFASCYFCGTAVEAPVEESPVVPDEVDPDLDTDATIALCPTCRRKLDTVLEPVVEAMETLQADLAGEVDAGTAVGSPGIAGGDASDETAGNGPTATPDAAERPENAAADDDAGETDDREASVDRPPTDEGESDPTDGQNWGETDDDAPTDDDRLFATDDAPDDDRSIDGAATFEAGYDESEGATDADEESEPAAVASGDEATGVGDTGGSEEGSIPTEDIPVAAYNKIVRLLKNREFPVERAEIEDVASSAYDIPRLECQQAIDAMVDRGVLAQEGGRLVRGDET